MKLKRLQTKQRGFVVVVVLCMLIMLSVLLLGFNYKSRDSLRAADDFRVSEQALNCAKAGLNIAIAAIKDTNDIHTNKKLLNLLSGEIVIDVGDGSCLITVTDENGKLNVNLLKDKNGKLNRTRIDQLLRLIDLLNREHAGNPYIGYGLVPSIIDWTDNDEQVTCLPFVRHENLGAESGYYDRLPTPYRCKNGLLDTAGELLLLKGVTLKVFDRMRDYVTVKGDGKININCASKLVIASLSERMDPALAQMLIDRRKIKSFETIMELRDVPGMTDSIYYEINKKVTISPKEQYYHVTSKGNVEGHNSTIVAILRRNIKNKNVDVVLYKEL